MLSIVYISDISDNESPKLLKSDPLEWKKQDHYAVLGLTGRYKATDDDIKRTPLPCSHNSPLGAYRKKVLKHHPDKTASSNKLQNKKNSDSFFKCIQKAWYFYA
jgi:DnaJ family protein C protein 2